MLTKLSQMKPKKVIGELIIIMIFSNNACMNILHITKVIIIILQGRND